MITHPTARFTFAHPARIIALGFGTGLAPVAPGTVGTVLAFPIYMLLDRWLDPLALFAVIAAFFAVGVWACGRTGRDLGVADHGAMCWDEVVAFLLVLALVPGDPAWQAAAFVLFRGFDILKPPPIRQAEARFKGGFGVMFDDLLAAGYTLLVLSVVKRIFL